MFLRTTPEKGSKLLAGCLSFHLLWAGAALGQDDSIDDLFPDNLDNGGAEVDRPGDFVDDATSPATGDQEQPTPEEVLDQADKLVQEGKYLEAIGAYSAVLNVPQLRNNLRALVGRGKAFAEMKNFDLALKSLDRAVNAAGASANPFALNDRGKVYLEIEKFNEAVLDFSRAVESLPTQTKFLKNYGTALIKQGAKESQLGDLEAAANVPKGIGALSTVINKLSELLDNEDFAEHQQQITTELSDAYHERGLGQLLVREIDNAIADLELARELDPDNLQYADQLASAYFQSAIEMASTFPKNPDNLITKYTNAIATLESTIEQAEALEAKQEDSEHGDGEGETDDESEPSDKTPYDTQKIPELYVRVASARIELAKYVSGGERSAHYQSAVEACQKTLDRDDQLADAYLLLGTAHRQLHDYNNAIVSFAESIRLSGSDEARFRRGIAYYYQNELGLALRDFDGVRNQRTGQRDSRALFWTGIVHLRNQDYHEAIQSLSNCINANPRYILAYSNRGAAYLKIGGYDQAIKDFNEVIRLEPNSTKGQQLREVAYQLKGSRN